MLKINDVHYIIFILAFWVIYAGMITAWAGDTAIGGATNFGYNTTIESSYFNSSLTATSTETNPYNYLSAFFGLFIFRIPGLTPTLTAIVAGLNYILVTILGLLIYRLARSGGG